IRRSKRDSPDRRDIPHSQASLFRPSLAASTPVVIGFNTRQGFDDLGANEVDNDITSPINGAHAVVALGYNQSGLIIENSWGETWGSRGFGTLSWEVVGKDVLIAVVAH
ncbi:C1 family peptidase, partial [Xanthomonas hortorum]